eukprot:3047706-Pyramimonas_sp.AAC.2
MFMHHTDCKRVNWDLFQANAGRREFALAGVAALAATVLPVGQQRTRRLCCCPIVCVVSKKEFRVRGFDSSSIAGRNFSSCIQGTDLSPKRVISSRSDNGVPTNHASATACIEKMGGQIPQGQLCVWQAFLRNTWPSSEESTAVHSSRYVYSAVNAVQGHYNNFGTKAPIPKKRAERIVKSGRAKAFNSALDSSVLVASYVSIALEDSQSSRTLRWPLPAADRLLA